MSKVNCSQHGLPGTAFVCVHVAVAIDTGEPVGFYFDESEAPQLAWCHACEQVRLQTNKINPNVNWAADVEFKSVCEQCYQLAKARLFRESS
jgi:hypothetical protein